MSTLTLQVNGMHCNSCGMLIDEALEELSGVRSSRTNVRKGMTVVELDGKVPTNKLVKAVTKLGYQAEPAS
ncbi:MAG: heavy-metal-associated domain-containing protein [Acidimicrobiales bacterium]